MNPQARQFQTIAEAQGQAGTKSHSVDEWGLVLLPGYLLFHVGGSSLLAAAAFSPDSQWVLDDLTDWWSVALRNANRVLDSEVITEISFYTREAVSEVLEGDQGEEAGRTIAASLWSRLDQAARANAFRRAA